MIEVKVKKLHPNAIVPRYMTEHAAGMDLCTVAGEPVVPCQLISPASGRNVIVEILLTLLDALEAVEVSSSPTTEEA